MLAWSGVQLRLFWQQNYFVWTRFTFCFLFCFVVFFLQFANLSWIPLMTTLLLCEKLPDLKVTVPCSVVKSLTFCKTGNRGLENKALEKKKRFVRLYERRSRKKNIRDRCALNWYCLSNVRWCVQIDLYGMLVCVRNEDIDLLSGQSVWEVEILS